MNMNYKVLALLHIAAPNSNLAAWKLLVKNLLDLEKVNLNNENIYALSFYMSQNSLCWSNNQFAYLKAMDKVNLPKEKVRKNHIGCLLLKKIEVK